MIDTAHMIKYLAIVSGGMCTSSLLALSAAYGLLLPREVEMVFD